MTKIPFMRGVGLLLIATVAVALTANRASALPRPLTADELEKESDIIATVRVLGVTCTGHVGKEKQPTYQAWLQVVSAKKGEVKPNDTVLVEWRDISKRLIGGWKVEYFPGEVVETHLKCHAGARACTTISWNAKGKPTEPADTTTLPTKPGESVLMKATKKE